MSANFPQARTALLVGVLYYLGALVGMNLRFPSSAISILWPSSAVLLAALLLSPRRHWWFFPLLVAPVHFLALVPFGMPVWRITWQIGMNGLMALAIAALLRRSTLGPPRFAHLTHWISFLILATIVPCVVTLAAPAFVVSFVAADRTGPDWELWWRSALSNVTALILFVPGSVLWITHWKTWRKRLSARSMIEVAVLGLGLVVVGVPVFIALEGDKFAPALVFLPLPLLLWTAVRFGPQGASAALVVVVVLSLCGALRGQGPFVNVEIAANALSLQLYLLVLCVTLMPLAVVVQERLRAEESAQRDEERLRLALEAGRMGVWDWDRRNRIVTWSKEHFTIMGLEPFSVKPGYAVWATRVHPADLPFAITLLENAIERRESYRCDYRVVRPDGSLRWVEDRAQPIFEGNECIRVMGVVMDVTDRMQAAAALRSSKERYRDVVERQTELVCRYLPDTTLTFVNEAYCRFFGRTREELIGTQFLELIPAPAREGARNHVAELFAKPGLRIIEHEVVLPNGEIGWQQWTDHSIAGPDGYVTEVQAVGRDTTDRKRAEEAMRELSRASRVAIAGQIAASIAHEINQPLGAILTNVDTAAILLDRPNPALPKIREILTDIRGDDVRASQIIQQLRSFLGKRELELHPLNLSDVVREGLRLVAAELDRRRIGLELSLAPTPLLVLGDTVHLQQVLLNLVLNAAEAMDSLPDGAPRQLEVRADYDATSHIELIVRDSGHGIPPEALPRIFDSFFTTKKQGMGIGLSLSRSLVEAHGGHLAVSATSPRGTTFRISLPPAPTS